MLANVIIFELKKLKELVRFIWSKKKIIYICHRYAKKYITTFLKHC